MRTGADVVVGDEVFVIDPHRPRIDPRRAIVIKAARVWLSLADSAYPDRERWRMRRDTQNEGSGYGSGGYRFFTVEQWRARLDRQRAEETLRTAGLTWRLGYRWADDGEVIRLADAVSAILADRDGVEVPE